MSGLTNSSNSDNVSSNDSSRAAALSMAAVRGTSVAAMGCMDNSTINIRTNSSMEHQQEYTPLSSELKHNQQGKQVKQKFYLITAIWNMKFQALHPVQSRANGQGIKKNFIKGATSHVI